MTSVPLRFGYRELAPPAKKVFGSNVNTLSLTDDSFSSRAHSYKPVPKVRSSHGTPAVSRTLKSSRNTPLKSQASQEFEEFAEETRLASLSSVSGISSPKTPPRKAVKKVEFLDGVQKVSYSPESESDRYKALNVLGNVDTKFASASSNRNNRKAVTRQADVKHSGAVYQQSSDFEAFATSSIKGFAVDTLNQSQAKSVTKSVTFKDGKAVRSDTVTEKAVSFVDPCDTEISPRVPERKAKTVSKQVEFKGGKREVTFSDEFHKQGISGLYDIEDLHDGGGTPVAPPRKKKLAATKAVNIKDGSSKMGNIDEFDEVTLSSLYTPREDDNTITDTPRSVQMPHSKAIEIKGGRKTVSLSDDFEAFASGGMLKNLAKDECTNEEPVALTPVRPSRKIDLNKTAKLGTQYSSDFETVTRTLEMADSQTFQDDTTAMTKSNERGVTSWVEFKEGKKHVRHSSEAENFSLGEAVEYTKTDQNQNRSGVHKKVTTAAGKKEVTYSDEFQNTMQYTDDFESMSASWATKVPTSPRRGKTTKQVELRDGRHKVSFSGEFDNKMAESLAESLDHSHSFEEVTVEDLESYSDQFDSVSLTPRGFDKSRSTSIPHTLTELRESSLSTQTPITSIDASIPTSIHTQTSMPVDQERSVDKTTRTSLSQLYTESFESSGFLHSQTSSGFLHSQTYSDTWESDVTESSVRISPKYRKRLGIERLEVSESEDEYTMTFTQSTAREDQKSGSEESLAERRAAVGALDSFVKKKMRLLQIPAKPAPDLERPKQEKLVGEEAKALKKFVKQKVSTLKESNKTKDQEDGAVLTSRMPSASFQLRGLNDKENVEDYGISRLMIGRLKAENTLANLKKAAKVKVHVPEKCKHCREKLEQLAAEQFMWHKKALVSEKLVQEKMEMQMLQLQDPMWLYAEALRGLPKVSDDPDEVYYKLMRPLFDTYAGRYKESLAPS